MYARRRCDAGNIANASKRVHEFVPVDMNEHSSQNSTACGEDNQIVLKIQGRDVGGIVGRETFYINPETENRSQDTTQQVV